MIIITIIVIALTCSRSDFYTKLFINMSIRKYMNIPVANFEVILSEYMNVSIFMDGEELYIYSFLMSREVVIITCRVNFFVGRILGI